MNISYQSNIGEPITTEQVGNVSDYKKIYIPANSQLIKKIENYIDNAIGTIDYYLATQNIQKKWTQPLQNWGLAVSQLSIKFNDRLRLKI